MFSFVAVKPDTKFSIAQNQVQVLPHARYIQFQNGRMRCAHKRSLGTGHCWSLWSLVTASGWLTPFSNFSNFYFVCFVGGQFEARPFIFLVSIRLGSNMLATPICLSFPLHLASY